MTCVSKRACVHDEEVCRSCKILHHGLSHCVAIDLLAPSQQQLLMFFQFVKRFRKRVKKLVRMHFRALARKRSISTLAKQKRKSVVANMKQ